MKIKNRELWNQFRNTGGGQFTREVLKWVELLEAALGATLGRSLDAALVEEKWMQVQTEADLINKTMCGDNSVGVTVSFLYECWEHGEALRALNYVPWWGHEVDPQAWLEEEQAKCSKRHEVQSSSLLKEAAVEVLEEGVYTVVDLLTGVDFLRLGRAIVYSQQRGFLVAYYDDQVQFLAVSDRVKLIRLRSLHSGSEEHREYDQFHFAIPIED